MIDNYKVYIYRFPEGYLYVGSTGRTMKERAHDSYSGRMEEYLQSLGFTHRDKYRDYYLISHHSVLFSNIPTKDDALILEGVMNRYFKEVYGDLVLSVIDGKMPDKEYILNHYAGVNNPRYGVQLTDETKKKISEAKTGFHHTEEVKRRLSETHLGPKVLYELSDGFVGSQQEIAVHLNLSDSEAHKVHTWVKPGSNFPRKRFNGLYVVKRSKIIGEGDYR